VWRGGPVAARNASAESSPHPAVKLAPARGVFPAECKWRAVRDAGEKGRPLWAVERYQYFDDALDAWTDDQPAACFVRGQPKTPECAAMPSRHTRGKMLCLDTHRNRTFSADHDSLHSEEALAWSVKTHAAASREPTQC